MKYLFFQKKLVISAFLGLVLLIEPMLVMGQQFISTPNDGVFFGSISGRKFDDLNQDGLVENDPGLAGWTITLQGGDLFLKTITDEGGNYLFSNLQPDAYQICEVQQDGWQESFPKDGFACNNSFGYELTLNVRENITDKDFGNYKKTESAPFEPVLEENHGGGGGITYNVPPIEPTPPILIPIQPESQAQPQNNGQDLQNQLANLSDTLKNLSDYVNNLPEPTPPKPIPVLIATILDSGINLATENRPTPENISLLARLLYLFFNTR